MDGNRKKSFLVLAVLIISVAAVITVAAISGGSGQGEGTPTPKSSLIITHDIMDNTNGDNTSNSMTAGTNTPGIAASDKITFAPSGEITDGETLEIHFINVGEADAIFITSGGYNMLIDAGESKSGKNVVQYLQNIEIDTIHYLIATHPDQDHIGGMDTVIDRLKIREFYMSDTFKDSKHYTNLINAVTKKGLMTTVPKPGIENDTFDLGQARCQIIAPLGEYTSSESNNSSIVIRMTFGEKVFLLAGDAEKLSLNDITDRYDGLSADVLKVPHHGRNSITNAFIQCVNPKYSIITCLEENITESTISKLQNAGSQVFVTGRDGTIICKTDGKNINFEVKG